MNIKAISQKMTQGDIPFWNKKRKRSIKWKLVLINTVISTMAVLLVGVTILAYQIYLMKPHMLQDYTSQAEMIANNCQAALIFRDPGDAGRILKTLAYKKSIMFAAIYDKDDNIFVSYQRPGFNRIPELLPEDIYYRMTMDRLVMMRPIVVNNERIGRVLLQSDIEDVKVMVRKSVMSAGIIIAIISIVAFIVSSALQKVILEPVRHLVDTAISVTQSNDYSMRAEKYSDDELGLLTDAFNNMMDQINERDVALRKSEERHRQLFETMNEGLVVLDAEGVITYVNPKTVEMFGYKLDELVNRYPEDFFRGRTLKQFSLYQERLRIGDSDTYELEMVKKNGEGISIVVSPQIIRNEFNIIESSFAVLTDITERKRVEKEMERHRNRLEELVEERTNHIIEKNKALQQEIAERKRTEDRLQQTALELEEKSCRLEVSNQELRDATAQLIQSEKLSALGELTAGVAHELNQPLNGIKIISQALVRDLEKNRLDTDFLNEDMSEIIRQINKMAKIIDHMRIFTRRSEGLPSEEVDVNSVIEDSLKFVGQQMAARNIEVTSQLASDLPAVTGDPIRLEQVIMNLVNNARNAVESSEKDTRLIQLRSYVGKDQGSGRAAVVIEVEDNGAGIPGPIKDKIFEPFFTTKEVGKGTGLGLSVSNKIIQEHEGRIEVESDVGRMTLFRIILPTRPGEKDSQMG